MPQSLKELTEQYYTIEEAQEVLERSRQQVYNYARDKGWKSTTWNRVRFFFKRDVDRTKQERDK